MPRMETNESLRERKKARTRDALIAEAYRLFGERGFEATTVEEIADAAIVSRRTFFRYFPTKEAVVFPNNDARLERFREQLAACADERHGFERLRAAALDMARLFMASRQEMLTQQRIVESSPALIVAERNHDLAWEAAIAEALCDSGARSADAQRRAEVLAGAAMGAIRATLRSWFAGGCREDLEVLGGEALALLADGFRGRLQ
jgi:AcrR family transcriptional regulator